jgi:ADP-heptose:LPS heptosyltransferase
MSERLFFVVSWLLWRVGFARRKLPVRPRAVLVVKLDHLGDALLATPALTNLRRFYPDARLDVLCARWNRPVFATNPNVNRLLEFSPRTYRRDGPRDRFSRVAQAFLAMRGQYDVVVTLRGSWATLLLAQGCWLDRGAARIENRLRRRPLVRHETDITLSILEGAGIPIRTRTPEYEPPKSADLDLNDLCERVGLPDDGRWVAFHVGSPIAEKRWISLRFATLASRMTDAGYRVVLVGSLAETPLSDAVRRDASCPVWDVTGKTAFGVTAALLARCLAFVGNDSAPMHLAAAVGTPTVGLFFASDPERFGPRGPCVRAVSARSPQALTVDAVFDAFLAVTSRDHPAGGNDV